MNKDTIIATLSSDKFDSVALGIEQATDCQLYRNNLRPTLQHENGTIKELADHTTCLGVFKQAEIMTELFK